jgi:hypothetical protein
MAVGGAAAICPETYAGTKKGRRDLTQADQPNGNLG